MFVRKRAYILAAVTETERWAASQEPEPCHESGFPISMRCNDVCGGEIKQQEVYRCVVLTGTLCI